LLKAFSDVFGGDAENVRNLVAFVTLEIEKVEHDFVFRRQMHNRDEQISVVVADADVTQIIEVIVNVVQTVTADVLAVVGCNLDKPRFFVFGIGENGSFGHICKKGILQSVLGILLVANDTVTDSEKHLTVFLNGVFNVAPFNEVLTFNGTHSYTPFIREQ
jgi:hypothetical protein